ncbi:MAG: hypothetical protein ACOZAN_02305 [Patescibacteria group bacterium]
MPAANTTNILGERKTDSWVLSVDVVLTEVLGSFFAAKTEERLDTTEFFGAFLFTLLGFTDCLLAGLVTFADDLLDELETVLAAATVLTALADFADLIDFAAVFNDLFFVGLSFFDVVFVIALEYQTFK